MKAAKSHPQSASCVCVLLSAAMLCSCATVRTTGTVALAGAPVAYASTGRGSPTVVFESGLGNGKEVWNAVIPAVERTHQVFAYDRPGYGGSRPVSGRRDPCTVATEERDLLRAAGIMPPYLLVGHSIGGLYQYVYAKLYPQEVAGIVLVDPTHPGHWQRMQHEAPRAASMARLIRGTMLSNTEKAEWDNMDECLAQLDMASPLPVPARVLVRNRFDVLELGAFEVMYRKEAGDWSRLAGVPVEEISGSGHYIQTERPEAVIEAIAAVSSSALTSAGADE